MILEQILKVDLQILVVSEYSMISSEPCAFVGPSHECTASVASQNWVLGRDRFSGIRA
ncbi:hypothetical protein SLEP1_g48792 [Rubroshorea leprosula]|uniref:Uncharacterized protein n=1 Tax=Rubroshorea leprosula TaxID=152421 RepID=A0AAV5LUN7_9ROSI|nr:hypothetical protein SLEP1_g48792 [Rubroshorea leprosula]